MKVVDSIWDGKIKPGFEMLVNNFSAGILSAGLAVASFYVFGPIFRAISDAFGVRGGLADRAQFVAVASIIIERPRCCY